MAHMWPVSGSGLATGSRDKKVNFRYTTKKVVGPYIPLLFLCWCLNMKSRSKMTQPLTVNDLVHEGNPPTALWSRGTNAVLEPQRDHQHVEKILQHLHTSRQINSWQWVIHICMQDVPTVFKTVIFNGCVKYCEIKEGTPHTQSHNDSYEQTGRLPICGNSSHLTCMPLPSTTTTLW